MAFRITKDDHAIIRAALSVVLDNDTDEWEDMTEDELERAEEMRDQLLTLRDDEDEEDDEEEEEDEDDADY